MASKKTVKINANDPLALIKNGLAILVEHAVAKSLQKKVTISLDVFVAPPNTAMGDLALPCFFLAKDLGESPAAIAIKLSDAITALITKPIKDKKGDYFEKSIIEKVQSAGPYVNLTLDAQSLAHLVLIAASKKGYGHTTDCRGKVMTIDTSSPNIGKPFGIGHLRSTIIGNAVANLYKAQGYKTIKINYLGDWGKQFGKLIVGWQHWGDAKKLKANPVQHLYELYVKVGEHPDLDQACRDAFKKLEEGDKKYLKLWKAFYKASLKEFDSIYKLLGVSFDVISSESLYNTHLKTITATLEKKHLLKRSEGALIVDLEPYNLSACMIEKSDGTSTYASRDIAAAIDRQKKYKFDTMLYAIGSEQKLHLEQFIKVLELMGHKWASTLGHVDNGLYLDTDGKKFSTRKGKTIFMRDILDELITLASQEVQKRQKLNATELAKRSKAIAIAALLYGDLKNHRSNDVVFDINRFLSFDGDTGPYLLYTYARLRSIIKKAGNKTRGSKNNYDYTEEKKLLLELARYSEVLHQAMKENDPSHLAKYLHSLAQIASEYYHHTNVLNAEKSAKAARIKTIAVVAATLNDGLALLGIKTLEQM